MIDNLKLRKNIINTLVNHPSFQSENGRKAILLISGLDDLLATVDLSGSATEFVSRLIIHLEEHGTLPDQKPALVHLLQGLATQVGQNRQDTFHDLCEQVLTQAEQVKPVATICPYRGISTFREEDEAYFWGREICTEKVIKALQKNPFLTIIGSSGSGKSSLVYAGVFLAA